MFEPSRSVAAHLDLVVLSATWILRSPQGVLLWLWCVDPVASGCCKDPCTLNGEALPDCRVRTCWSNAGDEHL